MRGLLWINLNICRCWQNNNNDDLYSSLTIVESLLVLLMMVAFAFVLILRQSNEWYHTHFKWWLRWRGRLQGLTRWTSVPGSWPWAALLFFPTSSASCASPSVQVSVPVCIPTPIHSPSHSTAQLLNRLNTTLSLTPCKVIQYSAGSCYSQRML